MPELSHFVWQDFCDEFAINIVHTDTKNFIDKTLIQERKYYYPPTILEYPQKELIRDLSLSLCMEVSNIPNKFFGGNIETWIRWLGYDDYETHFLKSLCNERFLKRARLFMRPDFILTENGPRLCEINVAATIGGMVGNSNYLSSLRDTLFFQFLQRKNYILDYDHPEEVWSRAIHSTRVSSLGKDRPILFEAIASVLDKNPMRHLFIRMAEQAGFTVVSGLIYEVDIRQDGIYVEDTRVDVVYTRFTWDEIKRYVPFELLSELAKADEEGLIDFISPPVYTLFDNKKNLALLSHAYRENNNFACGNVIPKTLVVNNKTINSIISNKNEWVIKPATEYGGNGVCIGEEVSQNIWEEALFSVVREKQHYVAQRKIEHLLAYENTTGGTYSLSAGGMVFNGEFAGVFLRRLNNDCTSMVINAAQGAECAPGIFYQNGVKS